MTAPVPPAETWAEGVARCVAKFYATCGITPKRREEMAPFFAYVDAKRAREAATEATPRVAA